MAGSNIILKDNQPLFKEGDPADGMYLIRKGGLVVYLEKNDNVIKLADVGPGGMIGEMAFFDKQPRSASVKAQGDTEVTKITNDDFMKLMKQIPKWFVSLMSSLSTRLRDTNERLQKLENKQAGIKEPYEDIIKMLHVINLLWHKDGIKENKLWLLNRTKVEKDIKEIFNFESSYINSFFSILIKQKVVSLQQDNYKNRVLAIPNRGVIENFIAFINSFKKNYPKLKSFPDHAIEMLEILQKLAHASAYDTVSITMEDIIAEGESESLDVKNWEKDLVYFKKPTDIIKIVKVSDGYGFKVNKKELPKYINLHKVLLAISNANLT